MGQAFARMKFGIVAIMAAVFALLTPQMALAQDAADAAPEAVVEGAEVADAAPAYQSLEPVEDKGMPTSFESDPWKSMTFQDQYTADGAYALWMHDWIAV